MNKLLAQARGLFSRRDDKDNLLRQAQMAGVLAIEFIASGQAATRCQQAVRKFGTVVEKYLNPFP